MASFFVTERSKARVNYNEHADSVTVMIGDAYIHLDRAEARVLAAELVDVADSDGAA